MNRLLIIFSLLFVNVVVNGQQEMMSPSINLEVQIDGENYQVQAGDTLRLEDQEIIINVLDNLTFDFGILSFEYPRYFSFSFEEDFGFKGWSLDGVDFIIMYFEIAVDTELDLYIKEMVGQFGKKNCKVSNIKTVIGGTKYSGKRININLMGQKLTYDMYKLPSKDSKSYFISFQDSKNDDGSDSKESIETMKLINETIKIN